MPPNIQTLHVCGDFACFTRPENKVERMSYPLPTPSAARGIFDAIYVKPKKFRWQITRIEVLEPVQFIALRRNEVKDKASVRDVQAWMEGRKNPEPLWADGGRESLGTDQKGRTQRQTMALKDVAYRLHARIVPWRGFEKELAAFESQFRRRASHGKCFQQPYFGVREFPAYFTLLEDGETDPGKTKAPFPLDQHLGLILYDVFDLSRPGNEYSPPAISLFRAEVRGGVLDVPDYKSGAVLKAAKEVA